MPKKLEATSLQANLSKYETAFVQPWEQELKEFSLPDNPEEIERREAAASNLLAYTEYTFPQYKADPFHEHLADALTDVVLGAEDGESQHLMLFAPPQHGKELSHSTPVPTPDGWTTHGDLKPGDYVLGRDGQPVQVLAIGPDIMSNRAVEFSDGTTIKCHANHEWLIHSKHRHHVDRVYETDAMVANGLWTGDGENKRGNRAVFQIDANQEIAFRSRDLLIPPYVLGAWLGDGTTSGPELTSAPGDVAIAEEIEKYGYEISSKQVHEITGCVRYYFRGLVAQLREVGVLNHKHIPDIYLMSSVSQRMELLAGLLDTDGYVYHKNGRVTFSNADADLLRDVTRLVSSLGWRVTTSWTEPQLSSSGIQGKVSTCQLTFNPTEVIPTKLKRKHNKEVRPRRSLRSVKEITNIAPEPGRCIQVEGGIYLVGDTFIPTHNSELVSTRLPSFWLGHNPDLPVALVSYGASLAYRNSRYARSVMDSPFYPRIFPGVQKDEQNWRVEDWHVRNRKGYVMAVGVGGPITGHGFGLGLIDDPIENWAEAQSERNRETIWQWWQGTFRTRLWEGASVIFMLTRWHEDDLAGRILEEEGTVEEGGKWKVLSYPALSEDPETDPLGREYLDSLAPSRFSKEWLLDFRATVVEQVWQAEYQQNPIPPSGDMFKVGRLDIDDTVPAEICNVVRGVPVNIKDGVRYWDLAGTEKKTAKRDPDSTSGTLTSEHDDRFYVLDNINVQFGPDRVEDLIIQTAKIDGPKVKIVIEQEPGQAGKAQIEHYVKLLAGYDVKGEPSTGDKRTRAAAWASQVNHGNVTLLKSDWNKPFIATHANFPHGVHDDDVDSAAGSFNELTLGEKRWRKTEFASV